MNSQLKEISIADPRWNLGKSFWDNEIVKILRKMADGLLAAVWIYVYAALVVAFNCLRRIEQLRRNKDSNPRSSSSKD